MANNKVELSSGEVLIDLTSDTVTASNLLAGETAHDRSGEPVTGTVNLNDYVLKSGDTMTGSLGIINAALSITSLTTAGGINVSSSGGAQFALHMSASGNQGIYSNNYASSQTGTPTGVARWLFYRSGTDGKLYAPLWASTGSSGNPIYMDSTGKPASMTGSDIINGLTEGTEAANRNDYIVAQYSSGGTTTTTYHRRKLSNIFAALNSTDINTALGVNPVNRAFYLKSPEGRRTDLNITHIYDTPGRFMMRLDGSTSTLSNGVNSIFGEGYVQTYMWDTSAAWDTQLYIPDRDGGDPGIRFFNTATNTWNAVKRFLVSEKIHTTSDSIYFKGTNADYSMIKFIDNTSDTYGNGIAIGGGGPTLIGGGESASTMQSNLTVTTGGEIMCIGNDNDVHIYTNLNDGWSSKYDFQFLSNGKLMVPGITSTGGLYTCGRVYGSGDDEGIVIGYASNNYASINMGGNTGRHTSIYLSEGANGTSKPNWKFVDKDGNLSYITHPAKTGTIAVKEDHVLKSGDTMTGNLTMNNCDVILTNGNAERTFRIDALSGLKTYFLIGTSLNQGIYSNGYATSLTDTSKFTPSSAYIIRRGPNGNVYIPLWASKGTNSNPIYFNGDGYPTLITTSTGTGTRNTTYTTAGEANWAKYGRICTVTISVTPKTGSGYSGTGTYFTGLPKPANTYVYMVLCGTVRSQDHQIVAALNSLGELSCGSDGAAGVNYRGFVTYIWSD